MHDVADAIVDARRPKMSLHAECDDYATMIEFSIQRYVFSVDMLLAPRFIGGLDALSCAPRRQ